MITIKINIPDIGFSETFNCFDFAEKAARKAIEKDEAECIDLDVELSYDDGLEYQDTIEFFDCYTQPLIAQLFKLIYDQMSGMAGDWCSWTDPLYLLINTVDDFENPNDIVHLHEGKKLTIVLKRLLGEALQI
jgi:hypothetical protein